MFSIGVLSSYQARLVIRFFMTAKVERRGYKKVTMPLQVCKMCNRQPSDNN